MGSLNNPQIQRAGWEQLFAYLTHSYRNVTNTFHFIFSAALEGKVIDIIRTLNMRKRRFNRLVQSYTTH